MAVGVEDVLVKARVLMLVLCLALGACGTPQQHRAAAPAHPPHAPVTAAVSTLEPPGPAFRAGVPAELPTRRPLLVQARIDDTEPAWFYLDTGATGMVITPTFARDAKL